MVDLVLRRTQTQASMLIIMSYSTSANHCQSSRQHDHQTNTSRVKVENVKVRSSTKRQKSNI
eukprot:2784757-Amphidinium_carterae.1